MVNPRFEVIVTDFAGFEKESRLGHTRGSISWIQSADDAEQVFDILPKNYPIILDERAFSQCVAYQRWSSPLEKALKLPFEVFDRAKKRSFARKAHAIVVRSEYDASAIRHLTGHPNVWVIPPTIDCSVYRSLRKNHENADAIVCPPIPDCKEERQALQWFLKRVYPRLCASKGKCQIPIWISFESGDTSVFDPGTAEIPVRLYDAQSELNAALRQAKVVVLPFRNASFDQTKIIESLAAGRPVVSTGRGISGLKLSPSYDVFVADRPDAFATAILKLLNDPELHRTVSNRAAQTADERFDNAGARTEIEHLLARIASA